MSDFHDFKDEWKELNDNCKIKVSKLSHYREKVELHRRRELIIPIKPPLRSLVEIFSFAWGRLYMFSGYPNSGKSEILRFLANHVALAHQCKCAAFVPEASVPVFFDELTILSRAMTHQDQSGADAYVEEYWRVLEVDEGMPDVDELIEVMEELNKEGFRFFIIDPMNWVTSSNYTSGGFEALRLALTKLKQFAKRTDSIVTYVEHPKTPSPNRDGEYPKASVFAINGGVMHWNKCDCIVLMHRIREIDAQGNSVTSKSDQVEFEVAKMKDQKYLGYPGARTIGYKWETHEYYDPNAIPTVVIKNNPEGNWSQLPKENDKDGMPF